MRTGGLISDFLGEPRVEELTIRALGVGSLSLSWRGGATRMGGPLGMPLGRDSSIFFQLYVNRGFRGSTWADSAVVSAEPARQNWIEIIPVATHLRETDQSNITLNTGGETAEIVWTASAATDVANYRVYNNAGTAGSVNYSGDYLIVQARAGGQAASAYTVRTGRLASGTWIFGVRAVDDAGNIQTTPAREDSCTVARLPEPPSALAYTYNTSPKTATFTWTAPVNWT